MSFADMLSEFNYIRLQKCSCPVCFATLFITLYSRVVPLDLEVFF